MTLNHDHNRGQFQQIFLDKSFELYNSEVLQCEEDKCEGAQRIEMLVSLGRNSNFNIHHLQAEKREQEKDAAENSSRS